MANTIQIKSGAKASLPTLNAREFGFATDTYELFIGKGASNLEILTKNYILDEDDMVSNSAVKVSTQQAIKAYVDAKGTELADDLSPQLGGQLMIGEFIVHLDSQLSANGKYSGFGCPGILGATLAFGDLVYLNTADQRWELADADAEVSSGDVQLAIVLQPGNDGDTRALLLQGFVRADAWNFTSYGQALFVSCTAGDMTATAPSATGDIVRVVGYASTFADQIYFNPSGVWLEIT